MSKVKKQLTLPLVVVSCLIILILSGCVQKGKNKLSGKQPAVATTSATQIKTPGNGKNKSQTNEVKPTGRIVAFVSRVVDGDTVEVLIDGIKEKVRLLGINAPESVDPQRPVDCFGVQASQYLQTMLANKTVWLKSDRYAPDRDKFERLLRYVYTENNQMVNLEMIKTGYAFAYTPGSLEYFSDFRYYEKQARDANLGLWNPAICPYSAKYGR